MTDFRTRLANSTNIIEVDVVFQKMQAENIKQELRSGDITPTEAARLLHDVWGLKPTVEQCRPRISTVHCNEQAEQMRAE
jgi:hypothetical protein